MKKIIQVFLTLGFVFFLFISCEKKETDDKLPVSDNLEGSWKLVSEDGGITGQRPPVKDKIILTISNDRKYSIYKNDVLEREGTIDMKVDKCIHDGTNKEMLCFYYDDKNEYRIKDNILVIGQEYADGIGQYYERIKQ